MAHEAHRPNKLVVLRLAGQAGVDPRSAEKAIMCGAHAVRGIAGDRISAAAEELGIELAEESEPPPPMKAEAG